MMTKSDRQRASDPLVIPLAGFLVGLALAAMTGAFSPPPRPSVAGARVKPPALRATPVSDVQLPGVDGATYRLGLADQLSGLQDSAACAQWQQLTDSLRRGLALVDAQAVPSCADAKYLAQAAVDHHQVQPAHEYVTWGETRYYELGSPNETTYYRDLSYTCSDVEQMVAQNLPPHPAPQLGPRYDYVRPLPSDQQALVDSFTQQYKRAEEVLALYLDGGNFPDGCYPPAAVFGPDYAVTFFPNAPVHSLREAAVPVFNSPSGNNVSGKGLAYTVKPGDTLGKIATRCYGQPNWQILAAVNGIQDVTKLPIGQVIYIPGGNDFNQCRPGFQSGSE